MPTTRRRLVSFGGARGVATKVLIDQAVWTPPLTVIFFTYEGSLQGGSVADASQTALQKLWPTLKANWTVWPLVHLCTFSLIPLNYRVLWVNCANFLWSGFLSLQAHTPVTPEPAQGEIAEAAASKAHALRRVQTSPVL